jgi:hypothetical protein
VETVCRQVAPVKHLADSFSLRTVTELAAVTTSRIQVRVTFAVGYQLLLRLRLNRQGTGNYCRSGTVEGSLRDTHGEAQKLAYPCFAALGRTNIVRIPRS